jgi:hypothetical protein
MLAGGDSIDDVAVLRAGAARSLFDDTRAPSTVGSWLRAHKWSNVRQLDAVSRELLARLWAAGAGPADPTAPLTIDLDSTIVEVHGRAKQGAAFGYTKVRGYHPQLATCAQTGKVLMSRLRGGSAGAARGAASFLTETISRTRNAGATGQLTVRADSAFYSKSVLTTAAKFDVRFSIIARQDKRVRAAIDAIPDDAWQPIPYWLSTPEVSGADIAETAFTVFASDKRHAREVRLVVRRVRPTPGSQLALFTAWDYHAFVTDRTLPLAEVEADHRRHAVVEQSIAELKSAGLAHLPDVISSRLVDHAVDLRFCVVDGVVDASREGVGQHGPISFDRCFPGVSRRAVVPRMDAVRCSPRACSTAFRSSRFSFSSRRIRSVAASRRRSSEGSEVRCRGGGTRPAGFGCWRARSRSISLRRSACA